MGSFRCEHDIGSLDYCIALFAFGKLQLLTDSMVISALMGLWCRGR